MISPIGQTQSYGHFDYTFGYDRRANNTAQTVKVDIQSNLSTNGPRSVVGNLNVNSQDHVAIIQDQSGRTETFKVDGSGHLIASGDMTVITDAAGNKSVTLGDNVIHVSSKPSVMGDQQLVVNVENHGDYLQTGDALGPDAVAGSPSKVTETFTVTASKAASPGEADNDQNSGFITVGYKSQHPFGEYQGRQTPALMTDSPPPAPTEPKPGFLDSLLSIF